MARGRYQGLWPPTIVGALAVSAPLAARRRFPLAAFCVLLVGALATRRYATDVTFVAMAVAAYSAAVYSRVRGTALVCVALAGPVVAYAFWKEPSGLASLIGPRPVAIRVAPGPLGGIFVPPSAPWRLDGLLELVALVSIAIVGGAAHAGQKIHRMRADHEVETRRALETERARIAAELHDVVTHNVSVMIVQAGAARQVLDASPGEARAALLAVESSGRAAMSELRHLLGLLNPHPADAMPAADPLPAEGPLPDQGDHLRPQPGAGRLPDLIARLTAAGLPVDLDLGEPPADLPPGLDLATYRVVQESLTNVLKHAGKSATSVRVGYPDGAVEIEVTDSGRVIPAVGPAAVPGSGRGLRGLRERLGVYGGTLDAGPRPGGGWRVSARIPAGPLAPSVPGPRR